MSIILKHGRPMLSVVNGSVQCTDGPWAELLEDAQGHLNAAIAATGRVEVRGDSWPFIGTAFLVAHDILLTSRSVASQLVGDQTGVDLRLIRRAAVELVAEVDSARSRKLDVTSVPLVHPYWDAACLRIDNDAPEPAPLQLATKRPAVFQGRPVAVLGYPAEDPRIGEDLERLLEGVSGVKRVMPGRLMHEQPFPSYGRQVMCLAHDASTSGGTGGAPLLELETGRVLGMHFAGQPLMAGYAVPSWSLLADPRVVDALGDSGAEVAEPPRVDRAVENAWTTTEQSVQEVLAEVLERHYPEDADVRALVENSGLAEVLAWLRPTGLARELGPALVRRERLDPLLRQIWRERPPARDALRPIVSARGLKFESAPMRSGLEAFAVRAAAAPSEPVAMGKPEVQLDRPILHFALLLAIMRAARAVCRLHRSGGMPVASGFLVAPRYVLVPEYAAVENDLYVLFTDLEPPVDAEARREVARILTLPAEAAVLLELAEDGPSDPILLGPDPKEGTVLTLVHYPEGGGKQLGFGRAGGSRDGRLRCALDTLPGSGGGPLLDAEGRAVAMVHSGTSESGSKGLLLSRVMEAMTASHPRLAAGILRGAPELTPVDPRLERALRRGQATMSVQLASADAPSLEAIEDLELLSERSGGTLVRGSGTSLEQLRQHPEVIGIAWVPPDEAEGECAVSVPAVGAPAVWSRLDERGDEALIAVIDDGADPLHPAFLDPAGAPRIELYWDQTDAGADRGFSDSSQTRAERLGIRFGKLYDRSDLERFLDAENGGLPAEFPDVAKSDHGTRVAGIAAGRASDDFAGGVAPEARLLIVHLDLEQRSFTEVVTAALDAIEEYAAAEELPVVVNLSRGTNEGGHDGRSSLEQRCEAFGGKAGQVIVKSAGNQGNGKRHTSHILTPGPPPISLSWQAAGDRARLQFWYPSTAELSFKLVDPAKIGTIVMGNNAKSHDEDTDVLLDGNEVTFSWLRSVPPINGESSLLDLEIGKGRRPAVRPGWWRLEVTIDWVAPGALGKEIHGWLLTSGEFDRPKENVTLSTPGNAPNVICVAAPELAGDRLSSRGPTRIGGEKPDLHAPGLDIRSAAPTKRGAGPPDSGTSYSAPHVAGALALVLSDHQKRRPDEDLPTASILKWRLVKAIQKFGWNEIRGYGALQIDALFDP